MASMYAGPNHSVKAVMRNVLLGSVGRPSWGPLIPTTKTPDPIRHRSEIFFQDVRREFAWHSRRH
jgi:hypothetical protein